MKNWLSPDEIFIIQPQTSEEVYALADDIRLLIQQFETWDDDFVDWAAEHPSVLSLAYHNDEPIAYIRIDDHEHNPDEVGKRALEFSGSILPEYRGRGIAEQVVPPVIRAAFKLSGKEKMLAYVPVDNSAAKMAISSLGFKYFGDENGRSRYLMKRKDIEALQPQA